MSASIQLIFTHQIKILDTEKSHRKTTIDEITKGKGEVKR